MAIVAQQPFRCFTMLYYFSGKPCFMSSRLLSSLVALLLISTSLQARDFPGYYITLKGDTVKCDFQFKDWEVTPDFVMVRSGTTSSTLYPSDIAGFGINGYGDYKSFEITYHKGNYIPLEAPDTFSDSITKKHSFLKILSKGKYSLYELVETSRPYYFYSQNGRDITELKYRVKRVQMNIERDETYKKTIFDLFAAEALSYQYSNKITKSVYSSRDIVPLFRALNEKTSGEKVVKKKKKLTQFELFVGGIRHNFPTPVENISFDGSQSVTGGLNFQYFVPSNFRSIAIGASLAYDKYNSSTGRTDSSKYFGSINNYRNTTTNETFTIDNSVVMLDIYTQYIFNPLNKVNVYAKAGIVTNFVVSGSRNILIDYNSSTVGVSRGVPVNYTEQGVRAIELRKNYYNVHGGAGLIAGRHKLEYTYYTPGVLNVPNKFKMKMMGVHYFYTIIRKG
jgi:hypothetical protein